jgi:hypothetical protein
VSLSALAFSVSNELAGLHFTCPNNEGAISLPFGTDVDLNAIVSKSDSIYCTGFNNTLPCYACPVVSGDGMLDIFDMPTSSNDRAIMLIAVACWMVGYRVLAFLVLRYKNHINK